jgi:alkylated DNA repair dioxygenase AlkB
MEIIFPGLILYRNFLSNLIEDELLNEIDSQKWVVDYDRRLQYYGYRNELEKPYDLVAFPVPMPPFIKQLSQQIVDRHILIAQPDQVIINEYLPGQGIRPHKDRNYFENQICGINLGSDCIMQFTKGDDVVDIEVPRRSLYVMQDEVRYKWKHAIPPRKKDIIDGNVKHRERRLSITYRKVNINKVKTINPIGKVAEMLKVILDGNII